VNTRLPTEGNVLIMSFSIVKWITEVTAQQECSSKKRAATGPPDDTATLSLDHSSSVAKCHRKSRESPI
jgi:hypothetical protein